MIDQLTVLVDGHAVGTLQRNAGGASFQYGTDVPSRQFVAWTLPVRQSPYVVEGLANLHPFFAGLLPEGILLDAAIKRSRLSPDDLFGILGATGQDAIGDVTIGGSHVDVFHSLDDVPVEELKAQVVTFAPSAIPGVQPKLSITSLVRRIRVRTPKEAYIVKVAPPQFPGLIENEAFCMEAARRAGVHVAKTQIRRGVLISTRFDRKFDPESKRLSQLHVEDALQLMNRYPRDKYSVEFVEVVEAAREATGSKAVLLDLIELYIFSYIIGNGDLHAKNLSLTFDREAGLWHRSPAYDLVSTLPYRAELPEAERMALALHNESFGRFSRDAFIDFAATFSIPERAIVRTIDRLVGSWAKWISGADALPYDAETRSYMRSTIEHRLQELA